MKAKWDVAGAFRRNSSAISLMILAFFVMTVLSTAYFAFAFNRAQFEDLVDVKDYDNRIRDISKLSRWDLTKFYWSNNLKVAGLYALAFPTYLGPNSILSTGYQIGMALIYNNYRYGPEAILVFAGQVFVHGILELTGVFIVGAASLRLSWKTWESIGRLVKGGIKRISRRRWVAVRQHVIDYIMMFAIGVVMIFLAGPIEAYISPVFGAVFFYFPAAGLLYLTAVLFFYYAIITRGFTHMRKAAGSVWKEVKLAFVGKWRPMQLSLLMLVIFSLMMWLGLIF